MPKKDILNNCEIGQKVYLKTKVGFEKNIIYEIVQLVGNGAFYKLESLLDGRKILLTEQNYVYV